MSMEVLGLSLEEKFNYLRDANEQARIAQEKLHRVQGWVRKELQEREGDTLPITGFVRKVSVNVGKDSYGRVQWNTVQAGSLADNTRGWWLDPYHYTICKAGSASEVYVSFPGKENSTRYNVDINTISFVTPEQIAETEARWEQQRLEESTPAV